MDVEINNIIEKSLSNKWIEAAYNGKGNCGLTLEKILNISKNNFELPDYNGIEIKTKYSKKEKYISLFHATPDSHLFEIKKIINEYGYKDQNNNFKKFYASLSTKKLTYIGNNIFTLKVDNKNKNINLKIFDRNFNLIDNTISWSFDLLKEKLERKLNYLAYFRVEKKYELYKNYFKYNKVTFYKLRSFNEFIKLVENGKIKITFSITTYTKNYRNGAIYDHGTSFSILEDKLEELFIPIRALDLDKKKDCSYNLNT